MGLSQGQKKRLYGEQTQQGQSRPQPGRKPQEHKIHELKQVMDDRAVRANAPAEQQRSKTFLYVAVTISLLLGAYVAFWVLPSYGRLANAQVPDLSPVTSAEALSAFASGLGDNLGAYTYAHRSVGIVFALFFGLSLAFLAYTSRLPKVLQALFTAAPVGYLLAHIATIFMLDAALADPAHQPGALNVLLPVDWALLLLSLAGIAYQLVRSIKDAASTFITGGPNVEADGKPEE